jgi:uncharacterized protein
MQKGFVSLADFPKEGMTIFGDIPLDVGVFPSDVVSGIEAVRLDLHIIKAERTFHLSGQLGWKLDLACSRCLEPFAQQGSMDIRHMLQPASQDPGPETFPYTGEMFDLNGFARELIELNIPMKPLCAETCRGLCPSCGRNLNRETCSCVPRGTDPRWEALIKLKEGV